MKMIRLKKAPIELESGEKLIKPKAHRMIRAKDMKIGDVFLMRRGEAPYKKFSPVEVKKIQDFGNHLDVNGRYTFFKEQPVTLLVDHKKETE